MPKVPGAKSTRKTVPLDGLLVASFIMTHEENLWRRPCVIEGCDHRMGPKTDEPGWAGAWRSCDENQLPAFVVHERDILTNVGICCPCHVAQVIDRQA
jgi:hypothetical protein